MGRQKSIADDDLLERARRVFIERGFNASTKEIARRAGVSEGVLFQRFRTKADLFFAAMVLPAAGLTGKVDAGRGDGRAQLEELARAMVNYFRETLPVLLPLISHPEFRFEEFASRHPGSPLDALRRDLMAFFSEKKRAGRLGPVDPGAAALLLFSVGLCVAFFERIGAHHGQFPPQFVDLAAECLWHGVAPKPVSKPRRRATRRPAASRRTHGRSRTVR